MRAGQPSEPPRPKCDVDSKPGQSAFEDPFAVPTVSSEGSSLDSGAARKLPTLVRAHYPLTSLLTQEDLSNVVKTQTHLRSLGMLHVCADHELQSGFIAPLRRLVSSPLPRITSPAPRPSPTRMRMLELTVSLVDGLVSGRVRIFKGLHAGFRIPDSDAWFWGLATTRSAQDDENDAAGRRRDIRWSSTSTLSTSKSSASTSTEQQKESKAESRIDIFVSLKAPSAIATVLHAWLSYHDVARLDCWDAEQRLETVEAAGRDKGNSATELVLPLSLRHELQNATYVELLALLHRFRCTPKGPASPGDEMRQAVIDLASHLLLETTTQKAWVRLHSYSYLIGETSIRDVLSSRLRMLARQGARTLPELDNLIKLHAAIEQALSTALVRGDDSVPNVLLATLQTLHSSGLTSSDSSVVFLTPQSDLLTLLVLLPLRRLALFEIFLEATDRCPIFPDTGIVSGSRGIAEGSDSGDAATGPDQAAVFTELWVLGSQCEPYFGVQPREVGEAVWRLWRAEQGRMRVRCGGRWPGSSLTMARGELMGMYVTKDVSPGPAGGGQAEKATTESVSWKRVLHEKLVSFGSMSIFCVPATLDVVLLTFAGRGLFMSAYMQREHLVAAVYALLISLLVSSGVVGWSASGVGSYLDAVSFTPSLSPDLVQ